MSELGQGWNLRLWPQARNEGQRIAPGPRGHWLAGHLPELRRDVLRLMTEAAREFGDVVRFRLGSHTAHLINHPDYVKRVLQERHRQSDKNTRTVAKIKGVSGESLLTTNGATWLQERRLMQPAFHHQRLAGFAELMVEETGATLARWRRLAAGGQPIDVASEMTHLTYTIVGRALFGADVRKEIEEVERAIAAALDHTYRRVGNVIDPPLWLPTPQNLRFRSSIKTLDRVVYRIISERRRKQQCPSDLLSLLLDARDEETGRGMSDEQLRNETLTLLLAGHETTANALTWTWYLLSQHPEVESRLLAELRDGLNRRAPGVEDLPALDYTTMVIKEAMRLYPPIWVIERRMIEGDEIGGYHIPAGSTVIISPYVLHRHPAFWPQPDAFDPNRFSAELSATRPRHAYIPFGDGPRLCIGNHFAMMEAQIIVAMAAQAFQLRLAPGQRIEPKPGITLRPNRSVMMTLHERTS